MLRTMDRLSIAVLLTCFVTNVAAIPMLKLGYHPFEKAQWVFPNMQGVLLKNGAIRIFYDGEQPKRFYVETKDFTNFSTKELNHGSIATKALSNLGPIAFDDTNRSGWFDSQGGGLIRLGNGNLFSKDFGDTWAAKYRSAGLESSFQSDGYVVYDPLLKKWLSALYQTSQKGSVFIFSKNDLISFTYSTSQQSPQSWDSQELLIIYQSDTTTPIYALINRNTYGDYRTYYTLGNLNFKDPKTEADLTFTPTGPTDPRLFDYGNNIYDMTILSEGEEIKQSRTLLTLLAIPKPDVQKFLNFTSHCLLTLPKQLKVQKINDKLTITQTISPIVKFATRTIPRISVTNEFKAVGCDKGVSYFISGEFNFKSADSTCGFYLRADEKANNYTHVGYDDKKKKVVVKRSEDVMFPNKYKYLPDSQIRLYFKPFTAEFKPQSNNVVKISAVVDVIVMEVCVDLGQIYFSLLEFSKLENNNILVASNGGTTEVTNLKYYIAQ